MTPRMSSGPTDEEGNGDVGCAARTDLGPRINRAHGSEGPSEEVAQSFPQAIPICGPHSSAGTIPLLSSSVGLLTFVGPLARGARTLSELRHSTFFQRACPQSPPVRPIGFASLHLCASAFLPPFRLGSSQVLPSRASGPLCHRAVLRHSRLTWDTIPSGPQARLPSFPSASSSTSVATASTNRRSCEMNSAAPGNRVSASWRTSMPGRSR